MSYHDDLRKVDRTKYLQELETHWHGVIIPTRRYAVAQVYGEKVAETYSAMNSEKQFFLANGRLPHPEDFRFDEERAEWERFKVWNDDFWEHCRRAHPERWAKHLKRRADNIAKWSKLPGTDHEEQRLGELEAYIEAKLTNLKR